jgi:Ulp1 protease family, C-terminal catalytic domain
LEGLNTEVLVWQQHNAWSDSSNHMRLLSYYRQWNGDRPIILVLDAFRPAWTEECQKHAATLNIILVMVAVGMTMPTQLTDLEFAFPAKATENRLKGQIALEQIQAGQWPIHFGRAEYHRLILAQHRKTVEMNRVSNTVVLGSIRTGLLARRPKLGSMTNVVCTSEVSPDNCGSEDSPDNSESEDRDIRRHFVMVEAQARSCKKRNEPHWAMNSDGHVVTVNDNRGLGSYVSERLTLPLARPLYNQKTEEQLDYDFAPDCEEPLESPLKDLLCTIVTERNCFGTFLERHDKAALTVQSLTSVAAKRLRREQCLKQASHCTCGAGQNPIHGDRCPKSYMSLYNKKVTLETEEVRFKRALSFMENQVQTLVEKRRKLLYDRSRTQAVHTEVGKLAQALCNEVSAVKQSNDRLLPVHGAKVFGVQVYSLKKESGGTHFTELDLPLQQDQHKRTRIHNMLSELGVSNSDFYEELQRNEFCIDYALLALANKKHEPELHKVALNLASKVVPDHKAWSTLHLSHLKKLEMMPDLKYGVVSKVTCDLLSQWKARRKNKTRVRQALDVTLANSRASFQAPTVITNNTTCAGKIEESPIMKLPSRNSSPFQQLKDRQGCSSSLGFPGQCQPQQRVDTSSLSLVKTVAEAFDAGSRLHPIPLLSPESWLADEHIDLIICHLHAMLQPRKLGLVRPCEVECLLMGSANWTNLKSEIESRHLSHILFFVNNQHADLQGHLQGDHWSILTVPLFEGPPCHWDSVIITEPNSNHTHQKMKQLYQEVTVQLDTRTWPGTDCLNIRRIYEQSNGYDCGIFAWLHACKFICDLEQTPFPFLDERLRSLDLRMTFNFYANTANAILSGRVSA